MGYYVRIVNSTAKIPRENLEKAYTEMCILNLDDSIKNGRSYSNGKVVSRYFSWMPEDYPSKLKTAQEILEALGFAVEYDESGDLLITGYDDKTGDEDHFLDAISPLSSGEIEWVGEDGAFWKNILGGHRMQTKKGKASYR